MIDLKIAREEFIKYTKGYNIEDEKIARKIGHSLRVMDISEKLAKNMGLDEEKIQLATLIGLLHDIGRFEQRKRFNTFRDADSIDHGDLGVEILLKDSFLRKFIKETKYDNIILKAIKNHNKYAIENGLNDEELLFAKIIRDCDKIDIFFEIETIFYKKDEEKEEIENSIIDENIENQTIKQKTMLIKKGQVIKGINKLLSTLAYIYDINYTQSFILIKKNDYINKILDRFDYKNKETKEKVEIIRQDINRYIDEKLK